MGTHRATGINLPLTLENESASGLLPRPQLLSISSQPFPGDRIAGGCQFRPGGAEDFFQALAPLFTHLRGHVREGPNGLSYFDAHDYVHRQAVGAQAFCRALVETAAFRKLLTEMILTRPSLGLPFEALSKQLTDHTDLDCLMDGATLPDQRPPKDVDGSISESELFQTVKSFQSCASENSHATSRPCQPSRTSQVMLVHQTAKTSLSCCF